MGALFGGASVFSRIYRGPREGDPLFAFLVLALVLTPMGAVLARRTVLVIHRRWGLARAALWTARVTILVSVIGPTLWTLNLSALFG